MTKTNLKVTKLPREIKSQLELSVEAPTEVSEKSYFTTLRNLSENVNIPGFRKGKAPREMVEKSLGVGYISQKAFENIFYEILNDAIRQENLDVVDVVEVSSFELLPGKPLVFKTVVELKPEVKLGKYKNLKIKVKKIIYDKDTFIDKTIEKLINNFISFKDVNDRVVKEGDLLMLDFEGKFDDGSEVPGGKAENYQALLEKDKFLPEFVDNLIGVDIGVVKEVTVKFPENTPQGFSGKKATFVVKVNEIKEKVLPEADDEFAKKLGLSSLKELKEKITAQMHEIQDANSKREFENKLVDDIIEKSDFEILPGMLEKEMNQVLHDLRVQCEKNSIKWDDFKADEKNKEIFDKASEVSKKRISIDLVLNAIVKKEKLSVSEDELNNELKNQIAKLGEKYKRLENDRAFCRSVELIVLRNKTIDFLIKNNEPAWEEEITKVVPD